MFVAIIDRRHDLRIPTFTIRLVGWLVTVPMALVVIREVLNIDLNTLIVGGGIVSVVILGILGLSLQALLSDFFAGVVMQLESPFSIGDWVEIDGIEGTVEHINWRTIAVRTRTNKHVIFPNSDVSEKGVANCSQPIRVQAIDTYIQAAYPSPPGRVKEIILQSAHGIDGVVDDPSPVAFVRRFGESSMEYLLRFWIDDYADSVRIQDEANTRAWYALTRAGFGDSFGFQDINIMLSEPVAQTMALQESRLTTFLRSLPLLESLDVEQIELLASNCRTESYTTGERLVQQGDEGDSLFIIWTGRVEVVGEQENGSVRVKGLGPGDFFGEMSLLTGEARNATMIVETETEVVVIDREHFVTVLTTNSTILDLLLQLLQDRSDDLKAKLASFSSNSEFQSEMKANLLQRITRFLGFPL